MRRKLELLKLQIKSAFLSIPKIILGTIVTAVLVIAISTCIGIATAQDSDMRMKVAVVYPDYDDTENSADRFIDAIFDIQNVGFQKDKGHDCEHEFRLLFQIPQCKEEHYTLNIGDIHDISEIYKTSDILNAYILN